ncbi:hypothetical protein Syun_019493 [Stephania yunnanensis]|uniref:NAD-dependent epimerase/dehydratase domain-containing protein n=1 Tax=Stephania yunnanensis TaxID=152371 RepID=A0AAP0IWL5_9MAGN
MVSPQGKMLPRNSLRSCTGKSNPHFVLLKLQLCFTTRDLLLQKGASHKASSTPPTDEETKSCSFRERNPKDVNVLVVGSIGYIGKFVVKELVKRGFNVIAIAKVQSGIRGRDIKEETLKQLRGAIFLFSDVTKIDSLENSLESIGSL